MKVTILDDRLIVKKNEGFKETSTGLSVKENSAFGKFAIATVIFVG
jgi:co-chaperonin GroES (HSP10)